MIDGVFEDRDEAGRLLAERLGDVGPDALVLALPRGGVPVAARVARALGAPLDVFVVRKLGVPGHEELAMGAVASGGVLVFNRDVAGLELERAEVTEVARRELAELERRERAYRNDRPAPDVRGRTVVVVDDGLATGSTMLAAVRALRRRGADRLIVAVPVAPPTSCAALEREADAVVCVSTPEPFGAVGRWYADFDPVGDDEVREALSGVGDRPDGADAAGAPAALRRLTGDAGDYDTLLERIGDARLVLLGEASHGTHEFYAERARITQRLIAEQGFAAVAVEADWPDAYRVNRFVRGAGDADTESALGDFVRFPRWMWRNSVVLDFVAWLREHNAALAPQRRTGFYGLDLYSLHASIDAVLRYLQRVDPQAAARARERYSCFGHVGADGQLYGAAVTHGRAESCEDDVVEQLLDVRRKAAEITAGDGRLAEDEAFVAEQNARLIRDAERYYRAIFRGRTGSWNLRDRHMADTLDALAAHLGRHGSPARIVVWAHNSHLGDARATEMSDHGEVNVGQLVRERHGGHAFLVGFTTATGTVTAASDWDGDAEQKRVRPPLPDSAEELLHDSGVPAFLLLLGDEAAGEPLRRPRLERAIGVVYRPESERISHYFRARVADQFDALIHLDHTRALKPLDRDAGWEAEPEAPETYPTGL